VVVRGHRAGGVSTGTEAAAILSDILLSTPVPGD